MNDFINEVYPDVESDNLENYENSVILTPRNEDVDLINNTVIERFRKNRQNLETRTYSSADSIDADFDETMLGPAELLNSITPSGFPEHNLKL